VRRTVRKRRALRWAVLGITGLVAVAGCGSGAQFWWRPDSAALYGNTRVTNSQLASESANLRTGYETYKGKLGSQLSYKPADIPRQVLTWELRIATINALAEREHVFVTSAGVQRTQLTYRKLLAQQHATLPEFAVSLGLPPDLLTEFSRLVAIQDKLENRLDHGKPPAQGTAAFNKLNQTIGHLQCVAAKGLDIQVNPQYGAFDYSKFLVAPLTGELPSGQGAAAAAHC
jgi:hypothetical protein